jgi:hypothetical protein
MIRTSLLLLALGAGLGLGAGLSCPPTPPGRSLAGGAGEAGLPGGVGGAWVALPALPGARTQVMALAAQAQDPGARITARWSPGPPALLMVPAQGRWLRPDSPAGLAPGAWALVQAGQAGQAEGTPPAPATPPAFGPGLALRRVAALGPGGWLELEAALPEGLGRAGDMVFALAPPPAPPGLALPLGPGRRELFLSEGLLAAPGGRPLLLGVKGGGGGQGGDAGWCALEVLAWGPARDSPKAADTHHVVN